MFELIFILILLEILLGTLLIIKINSLTKQATILNHNIINSGFQGNLSEIKTKLQLINKKIATIDINKEKETKFENIIKVLNTIILSLSMFKWISKNKKTMKKHK